MYQMNFRFLEQYAPMMLEGMGRSAIIIVCSLVLSFCLGTVMALFRNSKSKALRGIGAGWVNFLRNTPFLVQLFFFFYGLPQLGINTDPMVTAIIALGVNSSATNCEAIRSGLLAVKKNYYECAYALGFSALQTIKTIVLPISLRVAFKPLTNNFVNLALTSSVAFSVTVMEIMGSAKTVVARTSRPFEVYLIILVCYCIFTFLISFISKAIDRKIHITL